MDISRLPAGALGQPAGVLPRYQPALFVLVSALGVGAYGVISNGSLSAVWVAITWWRNRSTRLGLLAAGGLLLIPFALSFGLLTP